MRSHTARVAIAVATLAVLVWLATSHRLYVDTLPRHAGDVVQTALRKLYSVVAFALAGFVVDRALPRARHPALRGAVAIGLLSLLIEIAQKLHHAPEGLASNLFDIACGAAGGFLGVALTRRGTAPP